MARITLFLALATVFPLIAHGQCDGPGWQVYDDGSYENGYGSGTTLFFASGAMLFDEFTGTVRIQEACICFQRATADSSINFDVMVWGSDGPGGDPGTLLGKLANQQMTGVPAGLSGKTATFDLSGLNIVTDKPYYVGAQWSPRDDEDFFLCVDESNSTSKQRGVFDPSAFRDEAPTRDLGEVGASPEYRAFGIRSRTEPAISEPPGLCTPTDTSLCLGQNGRFRVTATFDDGSRQDVAMARAFDDIADSGLFWFYSAGNLEMLVKILDGCPINQRFWVYFAATTDVGFELTVEDLEAGTSKVYGNELGMRANAVTDTDAFATCGV